MTTLTMTPRDRVADNTDPVANEQIRTRTDQSIEFYARHPELIDLRMAELGEEWDVERVLMTQASAMFLASTAFSILFSRKWLVLSTVVGGFLLNHAVKGWCPPVPILRKFGVRTKEEIMREYIALRAIQGDLDKLADARTKTVEERLKVVEELF